MALERSHFLYPRVKFQGAQINEDGGGGGIRFWQHKLAGGDDRRTFSHQAFFGALGRESPQLSEIRDSKSTLFTVGERTIWIYSYLSCDAF